MKKYLNYILTIVIVLFLTISPIKISADSGFDADYDYDSSSSSSSDYDYDSGSSSSSYSDYYSSSSSSSGYGYNLSWVADINLIVKSLLTSLFALIIYTIIANIIVIKLKREKTSIIYKLIYYGYMIVYWGFSTLIIYVNFSIEGICTLILMYTILLLMNESNITIFNPIKRKKKILNNGIDTSKFIKINNPVLERKLFDIYKNVQIAWMNMDLEPVRGVLTDEMYNMYKMQLMTLKNQSRKNIIKNIKFIDAKLISQNVVNGKKEMDIMLKVSCKDYVIDTRTNKAVRGSSDIKHEYTYQLTFIKNDNIDIVKCPNCGGELEGSNSECKYCRSVIIHESKEYILARKQILNQRKKKTIANFKIVVQVLISLLLLMLIVIRCFQF